MHGNKLHSADTARRNTSIKKSLMWAAAIATTLIMLPLVFNVRAIEHFPYFFHIDAEVYREGAKAFLSGENLYTQDYKVGGIFLPFTYPPIAAALFVPLGITPSSLAGVLLTLISAVLLWWCIAIVLRRLFKQLSTPDSRVFAFILLPIALATEPVFQTLQFGQINILLMTLVLIDTFSKKPWLPRGFWIGLAAAIKLTPAVFGLYFLIKKDWKAAGVSIASGIGFSAIAFLFLPASSRMYWTETLSDPSRIGNLSYITNQSFRGLLSRLMHHAQDTVELIWLVFVVLCLIGIAVAMLRLVKVGLPHGALLLNSLIALLSSPVSWSHHWVWLVLIALALGISAWQQRETATTTAITAGTLSGLALVAMLVPTFWQMPYDPDGAPHWPLLLQPSGNSYVVIAVIIIVTTLANPNIFGAANHEQHAAKPGQLKHEFWVLAAVLSAMIITALYLLVNIWFKGNDTNDVLVQYPEKLLSREGISAFADLILTPLYSESNLVILIVLGVVNVVALVWTIFVLLNRVFPEHTNRYTILATLIFALISFPVQDALNVGSLTLLVLALVITDFLWLQDDRYRGILSGLAAGLVGWPVLILLGFIAQRRYLIAFKALSTTLVLWVASEFLHPNSQWDKLLSQWFSGRDGADNISGFALIARWFSDSPLAMTFWFLLALALGIAAIQRSYSSEKPLLSQALSIALPALVLPTVDLELWVLLLPLAAVLIASARGSLAYLLIFLMAIFWTPAQLSYTAAFPLNNPKSAYFDTHFIWYVLVEPLAFAPAAILLATYVTCLKKRTPAIVLSS